MFLFFEGPKPTDSKPKRILSRIAQHFLVVDTFQYRLQGVSLTVEEESYVK